MSVIKVDSIKNIQVYPKVFFFKWGTTSYVYKMNENEVLKVYRDTFRKRAIFDARDMNEILNRLSNIKLDSFVTPNDIYIDDDSNILGYSMNLVKGSSTNRIDSYLELKTLIEYVKKLDEDNKRLSEEKYLIRDLHEKNMYLTSDGFKVIDLDGGFFNLKEPISNVYKINNSFLKRCIVKGLFGVSSTDEINVTDFDISDCYYGGNIVDMIELLGEKTGKSNPLVGDVKRLSRRVCFVYDSYYHKW